MTSYVQTKDCVIYKKNPIKRPSQFLTCFTSFGFQKRRTTDLLDPKQENFLCPMAHVGVTYSRSLNKFTDRLRLNVALGLFYLNAKKTPITTKYLIIPDMNSQITKETLQDQKTYHDIEYHYLFRTLGIYNQISVEGRLMVKKEIQPLLEIGFLSTSIYSVKINSTYLFERVRTQHQSDGISSLYCRDNCFSRNIH